VQEERKIVLRRSWWKKREYCGGGEEDEIEGKLPVYQRKSNASEAIKVLFNKKICGQNCHKDS